MPRKKASSEKPGSRDAPAALLSRRSLYFAGGVLTWRDEGDIPQGRLTAKIAEALEEDDGLGSEMRINWEFLPGDVPQTIGRVTWIGRGFKMHMVGLDMKKQDGSTWRRMFKPRWSTHQNGSFEFDDGTPVMGDEEGESLWIKLTPWGRRRQTRWEIWQEGKVLPDAPLEFPAVKSSVPMREYWWTGTGGVIQRHRAKPPGGHFARTRFFSAGDTAFAREDILVLPAGAACEPLSVELRRIAKAWIDKPWPLSVVEHPDSTPGKIRLVKNPSFWRRQDAISGLHKLVQGLEAGGDTETLVRIALQTGADLARLEQEPLIPGIRHIQTLHEKNQGRTPSAATAQLIHAVEDFTRRQWKNSPRIRAAEVLNRLIKAARERQTPIGIQVESDGEHRFYDTRLVEDLDWSAATVRRRIHDFLKVLNSK